MDTKTKFTTIEEYIATFPKETQNLLNLVRKTCKEVAPEATEGISYNMPALSYKGVLVYFAAFKNHIGFYPFPSGVEAFQAELGKYKTSKGAIQFPIKEPLPLELIKRIVEYRLQTKKT